MTELDRPLCDASFRRFRTIWRLLPKSSARVAPRYLRAMGVLSTTATVSAVGLSIAIAVVLFTTQ